MDSPVSSTQDRPGRNAARARDPVAEEAARRARVAGGNAVDMVLAGLLAGATRACESSLLGGGGLLVVGPGVGQHFIDGRARAPGLKARRRVRKPEVAPAHWSAAVPGLLPAVLAAQTRFGELTLQQLVQVSASVLKDDGADGPTKARMKFLDRFARIGVDAFAREGVWRAVMDAAGPVAEGLFTDDDLAAVAAPVLDLPACTDGEHDAFTPPRGRPYGAHAPDPLPEIAIESLVAADMHGVTAAACWCVPRTAVALETPYALGLAALLPEARKGVARYSPGMRLPLPLPLAILRTGGRAWAGCALSGGGALVAARDRAVVERLGATGITLALGDSTSTPAPAHGVAAWVVRDADGDRITTALAAV